MNKLFALYSSSGVRAEMMATFETIKIKLVLSPTWINVDFVIA